MYRTERLWNYQTVIHTMSVLWDVIAEDDAPPYVPDIIGEYYVGLYHGETYIGMFRVHQLTSVLWQVHAFMLPDQRKHSDAAGEQFKKWALENLPDAKKFIVNVPECFPNVIDFVKRIGFEEQGYNSDSYMKNGLTGTYQLGMKTEDMK